MGLFSWTPGQLLSKKFWIAVKKEGYLKAYIRGHRAIRSSHMIGGHESIVREVGTDQFGNKYFEDWDVDSKNQRRWVEYKDYFLRIGINGDRIPAGWHGWLAHHYDDSPAEKTFVQPHYIVDHTETTTNTPLHHKPKGTPQNIDRLDFIKTNSDRKAQPWQPPQSGQYQMQGKKVVVQKQTKYEDLTLKGDD